MSLVSKLRLPVLLGMLSLLSFSCYYLILVKEQVVILEFEFFSISSVSFSFLVILDKVSLSFGGVVTIISACVFTFACKYMEEDIFFYRFIWILAAFVISMSLLIFSGSIFFLLLGWDGLGITSFALIIYYQSFESLSAGFQTLMANRVGDALIVSSMFLFVLQGQFTFASLWPTMSVLVLLLAVAALTKSAQFPFSSWLPAAMAAPTPVSALVHSSTLVTAGIFLIIRLSYNLPLSSSTSSMLLLAGAITCLLGGWAATYENDIKKIIALSTLSQLGVMVFCLGLGSTPLALFHLYTHALFKALLFLAAGALLMASFGAQDIRLLGSVGLSMPFAMVLFNISSLCLVGAPFLSAFYSKHLILEVMFQSGINLFSIFIMLMATMMTAKYVARSLKAVVWSKPIMPGISPPSTMYINLPMLVLGLGGIMGGKVLASLDLMNVDVVFLPGLMSSMINLVTLIGIILGLLMFGVRRSHSLSTLFFLTPVFSFSNKVLAPLSLSLSNLDYGWVEPIFLIKNNLLMVSSSWSQIFTWPNAYGTVTRGLVSLFILVIVYSFVF
uniref:NADH dehydrogenase subunit 5 n=1 Tax=Peronia verruculata TaxID=500109 RepID=UPI00226D3527|nr:NADH dehydrogenase subunit 5 [Peronia verruculata]UZH97754.1 NADH dehydrogenase subunit 5 [Peronia verruculata]